MLTGGGICMELLVPVGWVPTYNIETITTEIMYFMIVGNGRIPKQDKVQLTHNLLKNHF